MKKSFIPLILAALTSTIYVASQQPRPEDIDKFFSDFTADSMRANPSLATSTSYFTGDEQERFERQLTPETETYRRERIKLARRGLADLKNFDRTKLSETQRVSADLMQWQLDVVAREEPYFDYSFPLNQFNGVNVSIVESMTVRHPLSTDRDAANYVTALSQVGTRMVEATAEASRLVPKDLIPPRFILQATLTQMKQFITTPPNQNPFVTTFDQRLSSITSIPASRRAQLRDEAIKIVSGQV